MPLFKPNLNCLIRKPGSKNVYGEEQLGSAIPAKCSIIKLDISILPTTVRADSSASRGAAREFVGQAKLLFPLDANVELDDQVEVSGYKLRVVGIFPRHDIRGSLDHIEVMTAIWGKA